MRLLRSSALAALLTLGVAASPLAGQAALPTGIVTGRILDEKTGQPLSETSVQIVGQEVVGTKLAAYSAQDGRYRLVNVRPGTITIAIRRIGYLPKTVTGLYLEPGKVLEQDVVLSAGSQTLAPVVVAADRERATVAEALDIQRNALGLVNSITREQIQKSPDSDAGQAAKRVGGISMVDGKYANARGLGNRYTTASFGDARIPSPDPEQKVVPLDMFPSGLLDGITVTKTFTPDLAGDFGGANINLKTREFPADRTITYSMGMGMNIGARGRTLPSSNGAGGESFAFAASGRGLPASIRAGGDLTATSVSDRNAMINAFRDAWRASDTRVQPSGSMSVTAGGSDMIRGQRIGYIASGTYSRSQEVRLDEQRALARPAGTPGAVEEYNRFTGTTAGTSVLWGGLLNLSTLVGTHSRLAWNNTYNRTSDHDARVERGTYEDLSIPVTIERLDYVQRSVWSSQLLGERETERNRLTWKVTGSGVNRSQPDRSELVREIAVAPDGSERLLWVNTLPEAAARTFADLSENSVETSIDLQRKIGEASANRSVKFGLLGRRVSRDAETRAYGIYSFSLTDDVRALAPEVIFGGRFTHPESSVLSLRSLAQGGSYTATDYVGAGYGMFDGVLSERWRFIGGARYEYSRARVNAVSTLAERSIARRDFHDILPSLSLTFTPGTDQNLRFALTRTLARPEYRELAALRARDVLGGIDVRGNPELVRTLITNADIRWEIYPSRGELLSVGVFAKHFENPIERVFLASNTNSLVTFLNAASGEDYGVEFEARRNLGNLVEALTPLTAFANATLMYSRVSLGTSSTTATNPTRAMTGQAPYIVNTGLTYTSGSEDVSATLLFNRIGDRIAAAGELPLPDVVEAARSTVDLSLRFPVARGLSGRVDGKNLLDSPVVERQGSVIREQYRTGRVLQVGFTWK